MLPYQSPSREVDSTAGSSTPTGVAANPLQVSLANTGANATAILVTGTGGTFPVSGTVDVTGVATETTLAAIAGYLDTEVAAILTAIQLIDNIVDGSEDQVDVVSSALPAGASTLAEQETQTVHLSAIEDALDTLAGAVDGTEMQVTIVQSA